MISGYCIAATADPGRTRPLSARAFLGRRIWRIGPPYWAALLATALALQLAAWAGWPGPFDGPCWGKIALPSTMSARQWAGNLAFAETWLPGAWGGNGPSGLLLGPAWTLCYEVQFYAVCGLILALVPRRFFAAVAAVSLLTTACVALRLAGRASLLGGTFLDGRWLAFAVGVLVYYQVNHAPRRLARAIPWALGVAAVALAAAGLTRYLLVFELVAALAAGSALCLLHPADGPVERWRLARPFAACGAICYSLYLVHWPVSRLAANLLARAGGTGLWGWLAVGICCWWRTTPRRRGGTGLWGWLAVGMPAAAAACVLAGWAFHAGVERRFLNTSPAPQA